MFGQNRAKFKSWNSRIEYSRIEYSRIESKIDFWNDFIGFSGSSNLLYKKAFMVSTTLNIFNIFNIKFRSRKHKFYVMLKHISHNIFNFMFFMLSFLNSDQKCNFGHFRTLETAHRSWINQFFFIFIFFKAPKLP